MITSGSACVPKCCTEWFKYIINLHISAPEPSAAFAAACQFVLCKLGIFYLLLLLSVEVKHFRAVINNF